MALRFSVLLSLYKNEKEEYLIEALDSILNQTVQPDEILIVKDGILTKGLEEILKSYTKKSKLFRFLEFKENRGLGLALRDGVIACKNELIARMDTDDICKPNRFEKQLQFLELHPEIALLGTAIEEFSDNKYCPDSKLFLPETHEQIIEFAKVRNPFKHPTVFFKKSAVLQSGNYRDFLFFEDYDLFVRIIQNGYLTANLSDVLVAVRSTREQFSRRGGWKYAKQDINFQKFLYKIQFINLGRFLINVCVRCVVRIIPNRLRRWIYQKALRSNKNEISNI